MKITKTRISGLVIIEPKVFDDSRGYFFEPYNKEDFDNKFGITNFLQDNESKSVKGVLRGIHFQKPPLAQAKLVRCIQGKVLDVAVDIRKKSPTYGEHISVVLSDENKKQLFIPKGFAHGFVVLSEIAIFAYKVDSPYSPNHDAGIRWDDKKLDIQWGLEKNKLIVSDKDAKLPFFSTIDSPFT